ncbi:MAG: 4Fe-4S dicluster domain-containing protein [Dysgonamonadaceae bacterium]
MSSVSEYFSGLYKGIRSLLIGMSVTWKELFKKKITQQYPENRDTLVISPLWRGKLIMPHDSNNEHACTACSICQMNCPNGTIIVKSKTVETEDGKKKKALDEYIYNFGTCTFCNLCVISCPSHAIEFDNSFENAIFTKSKLIEQLNREGSKLREKKVAPKPVAETPKTAVETTVKETPKATETAAASVSPEAPKADKETPKAE